MLVSFDINLSGETRNSVGMVRLAKPVPWILVKPDKYDIQRH